MKELIAVRGHSYGQQFRIPGSHYLASEKDAKLLVAVKKAEYAPKVELEPPKPKRTYTRRTPAAGRSAGYSTKIMTAE